MKIRSNLGTAFALLLAGASISFASTNDFGGEYADKKSLGGQGVFQLSITQNGNDAQLSFDAAYSDGHGAAPEGDGTGKITGVKLHFTFKDSFGNTGSGTITRAGDDVILSMNTSRVADSRCLAFYGASMRLKRIGKK